MSQQHNSIRIDTRPIIHLILSPVDRAEVVHSQHRTVGRSLPARSSVGVRFVAQYQRRHPVALDHDYGDALPSHPCRHEEVSDPEIPCEANHLKGL